MKKISKRLASLLCAVLALTMLLPAAFAAEPVTVALSSVSGQPGPDGNGRRYHQRKIQRRQRQHDCQLRSRKARIRLLQGRRVRRPCGGRALSGKRQSRARQDFHCLYGQWNPSGEGNDRADHLQNPERFRQYPAEAGDEGACGLHAGWHGNRPDGYGQDGKRQRFHQSAYNRPCHNQAHHNSA